MTFPRPGRRILMAALLATAAVLPAAAQDTEADASPDMVRALEHRLEIGRHERFVEARRQAGQSIAPFVSDGCSGGLSAAWVFVSSSFPVIARYHGEHPPWEGCCVTHDRAYHTGGPTDGDAEASFEARRTADEELRQCVVRIGADRIETLEAAYGVSGDWIAMFYRSIADVMHRAVRLGGMPCTDLSWRWGFGWPRC